MDVFSPDRKNAWKLSLGANLILILSACAGDYKATPGLKTPAPLDAMGQTAYTVDQPADYRLNPGDAVQVKVYGEPDLSFDHLYLAQNGLISLPVAGNIRAAGLTVTQLGAQITEALSRQLRDPQVAVNIVEYASQRITVEGSVVRPGVYVAPPGTTLLDALALAGDPDRLAKSNQILVFRTDATGRSLAVFNLHDMRAGQMIDPVLQANDRVVVGVSGSARLYQDLLQLVPAVAIFTRY